MRFGRTALLVAATLWLGCTTQDPSAETSGVASTGQASETRSSDPATGGPSTQSDTEDAASDGSGWPDGTSTHASSTSGGSGGDTGDTGTTGSAGYRPITVAVVSDLNGSYGSTTYDAAVHDAVSAIVGLSPDVVLSTGDMVAGQQAGLDYAAMWAGFHAAVSDPLEGARIPFAVAPGNHDASGYPAFMQERDVYEAQWLARKPDLAYVDDAAYPFRYSFTMGPAMFVALDDTTIGPLSGEQMAWLADQLEAGADYPIKIVYGHVPLYAFAQGREDEIIGDPALEQMLLDHGVTMFISGHHHAYYPGRRGSLGLIGTACLGGGPRALVGAAAPSAKAILVLELSANGEVEVLDARTGVDYAEVIARSELPEQITVAGVTVVRDDL